MSNTTVQEFMMYFFCDLASTDDEDDEHDVCPFQKETNHGKASKVYYGERQMTRRDAYYMKTHFDEDALIKKVNELEEHIQQNLADELHDRGIDVGIWNLSEVMCNLFRGYMDDMSKKKINKTNAKNNSPLCRQTESKRDSETELVFDAKTMELARNFCIDHEEQKKLFVLCQIADYIDPLHKHVRSLYTEYLRQNDEVKKAIMVLNNIPILHFEKHWEYNYLDEFREDIKNLKLVTEKDLLYEGGKYFHRAREYADTVIINMDPKIFPAVPNEIRKMFFKQPDRDNLLNYIDEYLYYKNDQEAFKYVNIPPFDWMMEHLNLLSCPEEELTYWMCMFIRNACIIIPREIPARQKTENEFDEEDEICFSAPNLEDINSMEDLYYLTLYYLHDRYSRKMR